MLQNYNDNVTIRKYSMSHCKNKEKNMTTTTTTMTKQARLLNALKEGNRLTAKQIAARFGIANPTATVSALRFSGYAIYANQHKDTKGRVTTKYRLGTPSRRIVAAGYRALANQE
jgi:predicted ArsR family transcriptional regulator